MVDLTGMSRKKKAEYIWEYYKLHIIGILAIILIVASLIYSHFTKIDYIFNLTMMGNPIAENKRSDLEKQLTSVVVKPGDIRKQATIDNIPISDSNKSDPSMSSQYMQKFIAQVSIGELDIVILDKEMFKSFVKQNMFLRLDNIAGFNLNSIKSNKIEAIGSDNKRAIYGINASELKVFKDASINTTNKIICIVSSCKQKEKATMVLKWILIKK